MRSSDQYSRRIRGRRRKLAPLAAIFACLTAAVVIAAAAMAKPMATSAQPAPRLQKDLDALVAAGAPGAILFVREGNRTVRLSAGLSDIARRTPMRAGDHFKIASLTKTYTAAVVLQLVGEGTLNLDDSVEQRLPGVVPNGSRIGIRQLLNHTSGLFDFEADPRYLKPYLSGNFGYYWSPRQLVRMAVSHKPLFAPGKGWSYSNTNYVVAQLIVEKVTGNPLGAELKRRIFQPLRLRETSYPTKPGLPSPYAHGYMLLGKPPLTDVTGLSPSLAPGSGGIVSTVGDVADFYRALLSGRLLKPAQLRAMKTTVSERTGKVVTAGAGYGLGIGRTGASCGGWGHSGELPGYDVNTAITEDGRRQAVLMINQDATTLPKPAFARYIRLVNKAFCAGA
jgi:D-alanyl-D-alanine carboxypeptidase